MKDLASTLVEQAQDDKPKSGPQQKKFKPPVKNNQGKASEEEKDSVKENDSETKEKKSVKPQRVTRGANANQASGKGKGRGKNRK